MSLVKQMRHHVLPARVRTEGPAPEMDLTLNADVLNSTQEIPVNLVTYKIQSKWQQ